jgi:hypothetical protein
VRSRVFCAQACVWSCRLCSECTLPPLPPLPLLAQWHQVKNSLAELHIDYPGLDADSVTPSLSRTATGAAFAVAVLPLLGLVLTWAKPSPAGTLHLGA